MLCPHCNAEVPCAAARAKLTTEERAERKREQARAWYEKNKESRRPSHAAYMKTYYAANREAILERLRVKRKQGREARKAAGEAQKAAEEVPQPANPQGPE